MKKIENRRGRNEQDYYIANNGEIQFTYKEAIEKWGITGPTFTKAIDQLMGVGLIDITKAGSGLHRDASRYALSDRWKDYGTDEFIVKKRHKRAQHYGFQKAAKRISQHKKTLVERDSTSKENFS